MDSTFVKAIWLAHGELRTIIQHLELVRVGFRRGEDKCMRTECLNTMIFAESRMQVSHKEKCV